MIDVIGLGVVVVDHQVFLPELPPANSKTNISHDRWQIGGPVPTALVVLSRFGHRCGLLGSWGNDFYGRMIEDDLRREGLDLSGVRVREQGRSGYSQVWVSTGNGERSIACFRGSEPLRAGELDESLLRRAGLLHLDGWPGEAALRAAEIVRAAGGKIVLDTGSPKPFTRQLIPLVDVLNCPAHYVAAEFPGLDWREAGRELLGLGPKIVTITHGGQGAALFSRQESGTLFTPPPGPVLDSTGAGDVFCGALIHCWLRNWPHHRMLEFAVRTATWKCASLGNREALPSEKQIEKLMESADQP